MRKFTLKIGVTHSGEKMRESRMRWFNHIQRIVINALVRNNKLIQVEGTKNGRGKQRITSLKVLKKKKKILKCSIQLLEVKLTFNRMSNHMTFGFRSVESSGATGSINVFSYKCLSLFFITSSDNFCFCILG